ncbi:MAG: shikimate dehydrogenase [Bacteroidetes bacterium]|nr:MAG: shikimate dehydrogenase [Bacteroidota bacterium]
MSKKTLGLIGYPVSHSWSANYFNRKFRTENLSGFHYKLFSLQNISDLPQLIQSEPELIGLNVTIPHKENVLIYLDEMDKAAREIGAVNTIRIDRNGRTLTEGFNTDVIGFEKSLVKFGVNLPEKALVLGTGGASKAVEWVLSKYHCEITFVSRFKNRKNDLNYQELSDISLSEFPLIINTTPLGMYPDVSQLPPMPYHTLSRKNILFDLIYNPEITLFLRQGIKAECKTINGIYMLEQQAEAAWKIWNKNK